MTTREPESVLEQNAINQLKNLGWEEVEVQDEPSLLSNFRAQFENFNATKLAGTPLSDKEFQRLLNQIRGKGVISSSEILRDKLLLIRDDNTEIMVSFFDDKNFNNNIFQVTHQLEMEGSRKNRYDVNLLVNGLPLTQIELKRRGGELKEAFNQVNRYRRESFIGLMDFLQVFIISNGSNTKYFSNSPALDSIAFSQTFFWTDKNNVRVSELVEFIKIYLTPRNISKTLSEHMVIQKTGEPKLIILRPYQIHAMNRIIEKALDTSGSGYIWHSTGSGKTLTSFKTAKKLSESSKFAKVLFLVDRKDLNGQTITEFNNFEKDAVSSVPHIGELIKQLRNPSCKLIVTTIQKLSILVKNNDQELDNLKNEHVLFMIDECHRSQFGEMHQAISKHFTNAQYFGFTGTPRFPANKSQDGRTTTDVFGSCLHSYLMKDAISDENILPLNIEYVETFKMKDEFQDEQVPGVNYDEIFSAPERVTKIVKDIIREYPKKSSDKYNAMFATQNIPQLTQYYDEFRQQKPELKVAAIFSFEENEEVKANKEISKDTLERIIVDYNKVFNTNYDLNSKSDYIIDVLKRVKLGEIQILLVVEMALTGFDSPLTNTLYFDKTAEYHNLIQAFSRVNRLSKGKFLGNVRCYRPLKEKVDEALCLFSDTTDLGTILARPYKDCLADLETAMNDLKEIADTPAGVDEMQSEAEKERFVRAFRRILRLLAEIGPYSDFEADSDTLPITRADLDNFTSKYVDLKPDKEGSDKISVLSDIDFELELIQSDKVNVDYILHLISMLNVKENTISNDTEFILKEIEKSTDPDLKLKSELLKKFLTEIVPNLKPEETIEIGYAEFYLQEYNDEVKNFALEADISGELIEKLIVDYEFSSNKVSVLRPEIQNALKPKKLGIINSNKMVAKISDFIQMITKKY